MTFESLAALFCAVALAFTGYTLAVILANWWADQWYDADGSAHHCEACGSPWLSADACEHCGEWTDPDGRAECVADAIAWMRYAGPLLAVGVALWLI